MIIINTLTVLLALSCSAFPMFRQYHQPTEQPLPPISTLLTQLQRYHRPAEPDQLLPSVSTLLTQFPLSPQNDQQMSQAPPPVETFLPRQHQLSYTESAQVHTGRRRYQPYPQPNYAPQDQRKKNFSSPNNERSPVQGPVTTTAVANPDANQQKASSEASKKYTFVQHFKDQHPEASFTWPKPEYLEKVNQGTYVSTRQEEPPRAGALKYPGQAKFSIKKQYPGMGIL